MSKATHVLYNDRAYSVVDPLYIACNQAFDLKFLREKPYPADYQLMLIIRDERIEVSASMRVTVNEKLVQSVVEVVSGDRVCIKDFEEELLMIRVI